VLLWLHNLHINTYKCQYSTNVPLLVVVMHTPVHFLGFQEIKRSRILISFTHAIGRLILLSLLTGFTLLQVTNGIYFVISLSLSLFHSSAWREISYLDQLHVKSQLPTNHFRSWRRCFFFLSINDIKVCECNLKGICQCLRMLRK